MKENEFHCFKCKSSLEEHLGSPIGRKACCNSCLSDVRCCLNCQNYDQSSYNNCKESQAERIVDKERANFCDWFKPGSPASSSDCQKDALAELNKLFK